MRQKKEENEIFGIAPHTSKGWLVYCETYWFPHDNDSSHEARRFNRAFPWKPGDRKGVRKETFEEGWINISE